MALLFGYDPGGLGAAGAAIGRIHPNGLEILGFSTCDSVDEAIQFLQRMAGDEEVLAAGIDTYLSWAMRRCGWREVDCYLRRTYPQVAGSVFASNSAAGSMAVQGMAMAIRLRELWPGIVLNETHPKVLYYALSDNVYAYGPQMDAWLAQRVRMPVNRTPANDHEWDAAFSIWATFMGPNPNTGWQDLMVQPDQRLLPAGQVQYYWPQVLGADGAPEP